MPPKAPRSALRSKVGLVLAFAWFIVLGGAGLLAASPAGAFISGEFGLQQRRQTWSRYAPLQYHGGPVIHASDTYAIYWDPLELYNSEWMRLIDGYFRNVGEASGSQNNVFALNAQYGETGYRTGPGASAAAKEDHAADQTTFRGAYTDTDSYPTSGGCTERAEVACLTDQEIKTELQKVIQSGKLPGATGTVPGAQKTPVYYILTPPGVTVCTDSSSPSTCSNSAMLETESQEIKENKIEHSSETGICGYHSTIDPHSATPIVYAVQPWVAGYAGLAGSGSGASLMTTGPTADVLACQDNVSLEEPNQLSGRNPFAFYGAGLADVIIGDLAYEQSDIVVDPLLNGWYQNASPEEHGYPEQADMCHFNFGVEPSPPNPQTHAGTASSEELGSGNYYIHWGFNSSGFATGKETIGCWQGVDLEPHITTPNPAKTGDVIALDADESGITLAAAPLNLRPAKEETRMSDELVILADQKVELASEITEFAGQEVELAAKITNLELGVGHEEAEIQQLTKEEQRIVSGEAKLAKERKEAEEAGLTKAEEEKFTEIENRLSTEHQRIATAKAADEATKESGEKDITTAERELRSVSERKTVVEEHKRIVEGDKPLAEEEKKLADEHRLIAEREPLIAPIYKWDFGYQENGKEVTEEGEEKASVLHTFPCAGTYTVSLTVLDGGGYEQGLPESVDKTITVEGKSCEVSPSGGESGGSGGSGSSGASSSSTTPNGAAISSSGAPSGGPAKPQAPAPAAAQAIVSSSLAKTVKKGLVVKYSVNEQVAGSFNVLLAASIAKRLGLRLPLATGLPAGTPPQEIVGKALLITTKGGHGTIKIEFGKVTGGRIGKLGKVSLMLQLNLRNAAGRTTTVLSKITLH